MSVKETRPPTTQPSRQVGSSCSVSPNHLQVVGKASRRTQLLLRGLRKAHNRGFPASALILLTPVGPTLAPHLPPIPSRNSCLGFRYKTILCGSIRAIAFAAQHAALGPPSSVGPVAGSINQCLRRSTFDPLLDTCSAADGHLTRLLASTNLENAGLRVCNQLHLPGDRSHGQRHHGPPAQRDRRSYGD